MNWLLILIATMTAPHEGTVMLSSDTKFKTEALCLDQLSKAKPHMDEILKKVLPVGSEFHSPRLECKFESKEGA